MPDQILGDIKVVEFAQNAAIPYCGRILAGLGADVVKVEPPTGDAMRGSGQLGPHEAKAYATINPGKRSMALDLGSPEARPIIDALFAWADVALVAFKGSDLERYGIHWEHARTINPQLIHLTHLPFGPAGDDKDQGGYDVLAQGLSGQGFILNRSNDAGVPLPSRPAVNDFGTGMNSALGVVAALRHRDRTGVGQRVDTALLATALGLSTPLVNKFEVADEDNVERYQQAVSEIRASGGAFEQERQHYEQNFMQGQAAFYLYFRFYQTTDGLLSVAGLSRGLQAKFHAATGLAEPTSHKPSSNAFQEAVEAAEVLFASKSTEEWISILRGVGFPCSRYNHPWEAVDDPQIRANEMVVELEHPIFGRYTTTTLPVQFSETPTSVTKPSPQFAVHTAQVLGEIGFEPEAVSAMIDTGVVVDRSHEEIT